MNNKREVKSWADALLSLIAEAIAKKAGTIKHYTNLINDLVNLFEAHRRWIHLLCNVAISKQKRKDLVALAFKVGSWPPILTNMFFLLIDRNRFQLVLPLLKAIRHDLNAQQKIEFGTVYSVVKLTAKQLAQIEAKFQTDKNHSIKFVNKIDPKLIGGIKIEIGSRLIDGSVQGQLTAMKQKIKPTNPTH